MYLNEGHLLYDSKGYNIQLTAWVFDVCVSGQMVYQVRQRCGRQLALEAPADADLVSTVPESATPAAIAYAETVGWYSHAHYQIENISGSGAVALRLR